MVVLRNIENVDSTITVAQDDIEAIVFDSKSMMPDGLIDQLDGRQRFLDLLRYVIDVKERGPIAEGAVATRSPQRELSPELSGHVLLRQHNCVACHQPNNNDLAARQPSAPDLRWSAKYLNPAHLATFIADPQQTKPNTHMPSVLSHLDAAGRTETANAIVEYLVSLGGNVFHKATVEPQDNSTIARGSDLFHSVGCVACHSPRDEIAAELQPKGSTPLGDLAGKVLGVSTSGVFGKPTCRASPRTDAQHEFDTP